MRSFFRLILSLSAAGAMFISVASAQESEMTEKMCAKVKTCALEEMGTDAPPEMVEMMQGMFDGMCASMMAEQYAEIDSAGLESEANACADSFIATSCEVIMTNEGDFSTPECDEFNTAAEAAGIETDG